LKSGDTEVVLNDIKALVEVCHAGGISLKCILETGLLDWDEKVLASNLSAEACADYVKTSTGVLSGGATTEDVALLREVVGNKLGVKASGGIRDLETAKAMIAHGANRIGASASVKIIEQSLKENQP
jgi:deoxyribose-phosphate aldolase